MTLDDLRRLNFREVGKWPLAPKVIVLALLVLFIVGARRVLRLEGPVGRSAGRATGRGATKEQFTRRRRKAINYDLYVQQLAEVEQSFGALVKQLPNRSEIDALLTDINQAGLGRGLQFDLFRPAPQERMADFYAELPINIKITGNYHDIGAFASDVAALPRIVTLNNVGDRQRQGDADDGRGRARRSAISTRKRSRSSVRFRRRPRTRRRSDEAARPHCHRYRWCSLAGCGQYEPSGLVDWMAEQGKGVARHISTRFRRSSRTSRSLTTISTCPIRSSRARSSR